MTGRGMQGLQRLQRFPPRFDNAAAERAFLAHHQASSLPLIRLALAVGLAIYVAFGLIDPLLFETRLDVAYALRFGIGVPVIAGTLALTWTSAFARWHQWVLAMTLIIVSATLIAMVMLDHGHPYYVGLIFVMFFTYQLLRIRYLLASAICIAVVLACSLLGPVINPQEPAMHLVQGAFLLGGFLVSSLIAYIHEFSARREYRQRSQIEAQQSELYALAYYDETTGLPNRNLLRDRLSAATDQFPGRCLTYSPDMSARVTEQLQLEEELRGAVREGAFALNYQPQVDLRTGATCGVEALLRWRHPTRGLLTPDEFLMTLDESGLLTELGHWAIRAALAQYRGWLSQHGTAPPVAVNLSPRQIQEGDLLGRIERAFIDVPAPPEALRLELTEHAAMIDAEHTLRTLRRLRERGIESALDDFGKGYSSLSQLRHLPVSTIKIDKSFMAGYPEDPDTRALVESSVQMVHHLGKTVLAEGVEHETQREHLARIGCDYVQGALTGMALAPEQITADQLLAPDTRKLALVAPTGS